MGGEGVGRCREFNRDIVIEESNSQRIQPFQGLLVQEKEE